MIFFWVFCGILVLLGLSALVGAPYVPTHRRELVRLFDELPLGEDDVLVDLGSGDGIVLREAAKRGVRAEGVEIHPVFLMISILASWRQRARVRHHFGSFWRFPLPDRTTVVFVFAATRYMEKVERRIRSEAKRLGRPLTLICYGAPLKVTKPARTIGAFSLYTLE